MKWTWIAMIGFIVMGCHEDVAIAPKPRMYPKIDFPDHAYKEFDEHYCDFTFDQPTYSEVVQEKNFFEGKAKHACWFDLKILPFDAEINFSYYPISRENTFDNLVSDAFEMASKHNTKADYIEEALINNQYDTKGLLFKLEGPVASPIQFYMSDSTRHFLRGSLYFNSKVNSDSIAPILDFVEEDVDKILQSLRWIDHE